MDKAVRSRHDAPVTIGALLRAERHKRGISQDEACEVFGVRQATLSRWEKNQTVPIARHWTKIGRFLHITRDEVVELASQAIDTRAGEHLPEQVESLGREVKELRELLLRIAERVGIEP